METDRLKQLVEAATPGPWFSAPYRGALGNQVWAGEPGDSAILILEEGDVDKAADAELCAFAPTLAQEVIDLRSEVERLNSVLAQLDQDQVENAVADEASIRAERIAALKGSTNDRPTGSEAK